jgi:hypothetical protein
LVRNKKKGPPGATNNKKRIDEKERTSVSSSHAFPLPLYPAVTFLLVNPPHSNEKKKGQNQKKGVRRETGTLRIVAQRVYSRV